MFLHLVVVCFINRYGISISTERTPSQFGAVLFHKAACVSFLWRTLKKVMNSYRCSMQHIKATMSPFCLLRGGRVLICLLLHYQENAGVLIASSNRKDLQSCSWIAEPQFHIMLHTIMQTFFSHQREQDKIMALIYALTSSKVFCMQMRCDFRDGEAECLVHPSFVARRIRGDLLWFVNMRAFDSD